MLNSHRMFKAALGAAGIAMTLVTGCASVADNQAEGGDGFPDLDKNWYDDGSFVEPERILQVRENLSKDQVRELVGNPHFSEGFFGVREWNYVFNLYTGESEGDYIACQYQVTFDDDMRVDSTRWRDAQCPALLTEPEPEPEVHEPLVLSGDVLFDFDSDQLTPEGHRALEQVAHSIQAEFEQPDLLIEGYTDRLGSDSYNLSLSQSRAATVGSYLAANGIDRESIRTVGRGAANPVASCDDTADAVSLRACLQPNRRVELTIKESTH